MIEVRLSEEFATPAEAAAFLQALGGLPTRASDGNAVVEASVPQKRGRKAKTETTEAQTGAGASAADPLAGILSPNANVMQAPPAQVVAAVSGNSGGPVTADQPKPVEQKDLIAAFTQLGQKKGRDAIAKVLQEFGATAVIGPAGAGIPQDKWAAAVALIQRVLA